MVARLKKSRRHCRDRDTVLHEAGASSYEAAGIPEATEKAFQHQHHWTTLGTEADDESGVIAAPLERRRQLFAASIRFAGLRTTSKKTFQIWSGLCTPVLLHRRETMACLHSVFKWASRIPEQGEVPVPGKIRDEILSVALMMPMAQSNARWQVETRVVATDATPEDAGSAETEVPPAVARALYWRTRRRGERLRLEAEVLREAGLPADAGGLKEEVLAYRAAPDGPPERPSPDAGNLLSLSLSSYAGPMGSAEGPPTLTSRKRERTRGKPVRSRRKGSGPGGAGSGNFLPLTPPSSPGPSGAAGPPLWP